MLKNAWYCAANSEELRPGQVLGRKLLGHKLALARTYDGRVHAVSAVCPHRGADLSRGRLVGDVLQCPMHGWCFDREGQCVKVPSQPSSEKIPPRAKTRPFALREQQGILWLWGGEDTEPTLPPPFHEEWELGPGRARYWEPPRLWKCSFVNAVENAIDTTHIPFVHKKTLGADSRVLYPRQRLVVDDDQRGFFGEDRDDSPWQAPRNSPIKGGPFKQLVARSLGIGHVKREYYRFDLGGSLFYKAEYESGTWDVLVAHSTPADDDHTWFFGISLRTRATNPLGNVFQRWFGRTLCDEDESEVVAMLSNEPGVLPHPSSVVGDEPLLAFRRIYQHHLAIEAKAAPAEPRRLRQWQLV